MPIKIDYFNPFDQCVGPDLAPSRPLPTSSMLCPPTTCYVIMHCNRYLPPSPCSQLDLIDIIMYINTDQAVISSPLRGLVRISTQRQEEYTHIQAHTHT